MSRILTAFGLLAACAGTAIASGVTTVERLDLSSVYFIDGTRATTSSATPRSPVGTTYGVFTGLATSTGGLVLLESSTAPVRDDIVPYDGASDPINDYVAAAGGVTRNVNEVWTPTGGGSGLATINITGSGELFPSGFSSGTPPVALTRGGFGIGLNLPALLGGADPLSWNPSPNMVTTATVELFDSAGTSLTGGALNIFTLIATPNNWNGVLGVAFGSPSVGLGVQRIELKMNITKIPTPGAVALMGVAGLAGMRRRRA